MCTSFIQDDDNDLTLSKANDNIVCILVDCFSSVVLVITAFLATKVFPATDQNFKCFTPTETNSFSEFGRKRARKTRSSDATVQATLTPRMT